MRENKSVNQFSVFSFRNFVHRFSVYQTERRTTDKPESDNRQQRTDNQTSGMTRTETIFTTGVLLVVLIVSLFNFSKSQLLARDTQRKNDLKHIMTSLNNYRIDMQTYPPSENGKILACTNPDLSLRGCDWGVDNVESTKTAYIKPMPQDPKEKGKGFKYLYISDTRNFQIYAHLERTDDAEYNKKVVARNLMCGVGVCNFGVGSSLDIPLDKPLSEYEKTKESK